MPNVQISLCSALFCFKIICELAPKVGMNKINKFKNSYPMKREL